MIVVLFLCNGVLLTYLLCFSSEKSGMSDPRLHYTRISGRVCLAPLVSYKQQKLLHDSGSLLGVTS